MKKVQYKTKIIGITSVTLSGILEYGTFVKQYSDDDASWCLNDGQQWNSIEEWLEKFNGKDVKVTIEELDYSHDDDARLLNNAIEDYDELVQEK